jgi:putative SOS response-associated peptidase YedK
MAELIEQYKATGATDDKDLAPSYNVAPTNKVYAVLERDRGGGAVREIRALRWGLVPAWWKPGIDAKTGKAKTMPTLHNARSDRLATAPSWRGPFANRRAVIPAAAYYEWLSTEDADGKPVKQPYYTHPADGTLSFAGLYELWPDPAKDPDDPGRWLWSAAIITHHATWLAGVMNDRTPVILPPDRIDAWLDPDLTDKNEVQKLITGGRRDSSATAAACTASVHRASRSHPTITSTRSGLDTSDGHRPASLSASAGPAATVARSRTSTGRSGSADNTGGTDATGAPSGHTSPHQSKAQPSLPTCSVSTAQPLSAVQALSPAQSASPGRSASAGQPSPTAQSASAGRSASAGQPSPAAQSASTVIRSASDIQPR